jgi:hypothetical protein
MNLPAPTLELQQDRDNFPVNEGESLPFHFHQQYHIFGVRVVMIIIFSGVCRANERIPLDKFHFMKFVDVVLRSPFPKIAPILALMDEGS